MCWLSILGEKNLVRHELLSCRTEKEDEQSDYQMNVKIFQSDSAKDLEGQITDWIHENDIAKDDIVSINQSESNVVESFATETSQRSTRYLNFTISVFYLG